MTLSLLNSPIPYKDESPGSFLLRATEYNGWRSATALVAGLLANKQKGGFQVESIITNEKKWNMICKSMEILEKQAQSITYSRNSMTSRSTINFQGMSIPWRSLRLKEPVICPKCIAKNGYMSKKWDLKLISMCTKHEIKLIDSCPECRKKLSWNRKSVSLCKCGYNLELSPTEFADPKPTRIIERVISCKDEKSFISLLELYNVLKAYFNFLEISYTEEYLVSLTALGLRDCDKAARIVKECKDRSEKLCDKHPRVALYPFFLSKDPIAKELAQKVLATNIKYKGFKKKQTNDSLSSYIAVSIASKILVLSHKRIHDLIANNILEVHQQSEETKKRIFRISLDSINKLLIKFSKTNGFEIHDRNKLNNRFGNQDFVTLVKAVLCENRNFAGETVTQGFSGISIVKKPRPRKKPKHSRTIKEVARLCGIHHENIRFAIHCKILNRQYPLAVKGTTIYIHKNEAEKFNKNYIFAGVIAKKYRCHPNNIAEKIMSTGVEPVSGPTIDGGLTYLFSRKDIENLDMKEVTKIKNYPTRTGRKKVILHTHADKKLSLTSAAQTLKISTQKAKQLLEKGFLTERPTLDRRTYIVSETLEYILRVQKDPYLLLVNLAAKSARETLPTFRRRWLSTKYVPVIDTGLEQYVSHSSLDKIKRFKEDYISSSEAGEITNTHRTHMLNLEKTNRIKPARKLFYGSKSINFYKREDVLNACNINQGK